MNDTPETAVRYEVRDRIAVLTIDFPPVNALGLVMREGMALRLRQATADPEAWGIVVIGARGRFVAGADMREFGQPMTGVSAAEMFAMLESSEKPVVIAIEGFALGGGLEMALAAPYRVADRDARIGLPEINLGVLPGAGGTQRTTRLLGPEKALDLILSGRQLSADEAKQLGLIDAVADGDTLDAAIRFANVRADAGGPYPRALDREDRIAGVDPALFDKVRADNAWAWRGTVAPFKIVDCIEAACTLPPKEGLAFEWRAFVDCFKAPSREAQVHLFYAERAAIKSVMAAFDGGIERIWLDGARPRTLIDRLARAGIEATDEPGEAMLAVVDAAVAPSDWPGLDGPLLIMGTPGEVTPLLDNAGRKQIAGLVPVGNGSAGFVEILVASEDERRAAGAAAILAKRLGLLAVVGTGESICGRLVAARDRAAAALVDDGTKPSGVDAAMIAFGMELPGGNRRPDSAGEAERALPIVAAMAAEGRRLIDDGIAAQASDVDLASVLGCGFPRHQGGAMFWAARHAAQVAEPTAA